MGRCGLRLWIEKSNSRDLFAEVGCDALDRRPICVCEVVLHLEKLVGISLDSVQDFNTTGSSQWSLNELRLHTNLLTLLMQLGHCDVRLACRNRVARFEYRLGSTLRLLRLPQRQAKAGDRQQCAGVGKPRHHVGHLSPTTVIFAREMGTVHGSRAWFENCSESPCGQKCA
jgi:hypothetical protein